MSDTAKMSPDDSPGTVSGKSGVRRVNNGPVYIIGGLFGLFLLMMALVAADRAEQQNHPPRAEPPKATSSSVFANELAGRKKYGIIPAAQVAPPVVPDLPREHDSIPIAGTDQLEAPPKPPGQAAQTTEQDAADQQRVRIALQKVQQLEEAIKARTGVQVGAPRSTASPPGLGKPGAPLSLEDAVVSIATAQQQIHAQTRDDPSTAYLMRLRQLQENGLAASHETSQADAGDTPSVPSTPPSAPLGRDYGQFDSASQQDRWRLDAQVQPPRSPYELRAGFVVPALLISGINSNLPGQVVGQVSQDVFDTATGKWTLIPRGSRLIGQYSSDVAYGQARILIAWQRIVFPDGKALDIGAMPGADSAGYAGFQDRVNNHYFRIFGSALLMSGVTAGIALSQPDSHNTNRQDARSAMSEALGQQLGAVTAQMIARNMSIAPTLEIRPGYRFNVVVTKDLTFSKPYRLFDY